MESVPCPFCSIDHLDSQEESFISCRLTQQIESKGNYRDIFENSVPKEVIKTITKMSKLREK